MSLSEPAAPRPADLLAAMPFAAGLGIELREATADRAVGTLAWSPEVCTAGGALHGGALMALADSVGAVCAYLNLPAGATGTSTVESKTNFLRAVTTGRVHATARPLHVGGTLLVVQTDLRDDRDRLVGQTTQTQIVLRRGEA
ncbi:MULTISPECIES: PaaI family thioesterase [unclassified Streptomyces]|uniref:PaaI family thioesterase n=1 Tax=unclassified Streptomyces TaxID=2593676 RepID=UPI0011747DA9|nr:MULTISPECIES: PaaI family thioesterase [unclassified Streptomyces]MDI1455536.1 PaaI family thioesterase [Streptomyces sp. ATE26]GEK01438.1 aromatic compound degradation protein PaaI [Streptomyces sp. 1-11]